MLHDFKLADHRRIRLWQRLGESYEHVLMKALGYAMYVGEFPQLEIETKVSLRYKPDLVALGANGIFRFWARQAKFHSQNALAVKARASRAVGFVQNCG